MRLDSERWKRSVMTVLSSVLGVYCLITGISIIENRNQTFVKECRERLRIGFEKQAAGQVSALSAYLLEEGEAGGEEGLLEECIPFFSYAQGQTVYETASEDTIIYEEILEQQARLENQAVVSEKTENEKQPEEPAEAEIPAIQPAVSNVMREKQAELTQEQLSDNTWLRKNFYTIDPSTSISENQLDYKTLMGTDMKLTETEGPEILIFHTHSQECFVDSKEGDPDTSIVAVGSYLTELLENQYGFEVMHHTKEYDMIDGKLDRNEAYSLALPDLQAILEENPSIQVILDIHSDGVKKGQHLVTDVDGKPTAQIMFFNGLSYLNAVGAVDYLKNDNLQGNLAFSFQLQKVAEEYFPGYARKIYLKGYRYNLHLLPKSVVIEVGAQTNTLQEELNAMEPLAFVLNKVLRGE